MGKATLKISGDEALSDESLEKSNSDDALNDDFSSEVTAMNCSKFGYTLWATARNEAIQ